MKTNKKRILKNYIFVLLDSSTSMSPIRSATIEAFNALTEKFRNPPKGQQNYISFLTFATSVQPRFIHADPSSLPQLSLANYRPDGWTALLDAVGLATETFELVPSDDDTSFLVMTITDGIENKSVRYNESRLRLLFKNRQENWTFTFQLPIGHKAGFCRRYGIPEDNVAEWEQTERGTRETFADTQDAMSNYYDARTKGAKMSNNFFAKVQSNVPANAARLLKDLSKSFREYKVVVENTIRPFVETKTGKDYERGNAYYLLMKPETVQPNKEVLIKEKGRKVIYGGPQARNIIGLPVGEYAKVDPGNHGNYDVFVQSNSVNRILPRGTKVLVRV